MRIIRAGYEILKPREFTEETKNEIYRSIETAARTCYKTERNIGKKSAGAFVQALVNNGHHAMLEFANMTVRFTVDRGISHELVRHRMASFAQESTRYCNYSADRFGKEVTFIAPCTLKEETENWKTWYQACEAAEWAYFKLLDAGETPESARSVLPTSTKTEIVVCANMREWRHFFRLRAIGTTGSPHPQMREVALPLLLEVAEKMPELFGDLKKLYEDSKGREEHG